MRLFKFKVTTCTYYPFGDLDYRVIENLVSTDDMNCLIDGLKEKLLDKLNLSTKFREEIGHTWVVGVELTPILKI